MRPPDELTDEQIEDELAQITRALRDLDRGPRRQIEQGIMRLEDSREQNERDLWILQRRHAPEWDQAILNARRYRQDIHRTIALNREALGQLVERRFRPLWRRQHALRLEEKQRAEARLQERQRPGDRRHWITGTSVPDPVVPILPVQAIDERAAAARAPTLEDEIRRRGDFLVGWHYRTITPARKRSRRYEGFTRQLASWSRFYR